MIRYLILSLLLVISYSHDARPQVAAGLVHDLSSGIWEVRRDAFERLLADRVASTHIEKDELQVQLMRRENYYSGRSNPDLFEDDSYLAYWERLTDEVKRIALETQEQAAWRALVYARYNPDSVYGRWIADQPGSFPYVIELTHSIYDARRMNGVYLLASMLAKSKASRHPIASARYRQLKTIIRWHAKHDGPLVSYSAIDGLGLTKDAEDAPFIREIAAKIEDKDGRERVLQTAQAIEAAQGAGK